MSLPRGLAPLRHRGFRLLAGGQLTSNVGDAFYAVALPWYVLAHHGGALLLGTVLAAYGVPRTVLMAVGGAASDRWRPWTVMMAADAVRAMAVAALAAVAISGPASATLLVPVAVVLGAGEGLFLPGSFAIVPSLLPDDDLEAGNALTSGGTQLATLAGPAVGGVIVAFAGSGPAFAVDALTFVVSAVTLAAIRAHQRVPAGSVSGEPLVATAAAAEPVAVAPVGGAPAAEAPAAEAPPELTAVLPAELTLRRLLASERVLQVILLVTLAANLGMGGLSEVALPALVHGPFHAGAEGYGALIAAFSGGGLAGTLLAAQGRRAHRPAIVASAAFAVEGALVGVIPYLGGPIPAAVTLVVIGSLNGFGNIVMITAFQRWAPPALLGRLMGLLMLGSFGAFPVSVAVTGAVVHAWGPAMFFPLASGLLVVAVLFAVSQRSWRAFGSKGAPRAGARFLEVAQPGTTHGDEPPFASSFADSVPAGQRSPTGAQSTKMQNGWPDGSA
jgi:MFS family permease